MGGNAGFKASIPWLVLALVVCPYVAVVVTFMRSVPENAWEELTYAPFLGTLSRTASIFAVCGGISILAGWLLGTSLALIRFPGRAVCLLILLLPITFPPFLLAIGVQSLKAFTSFRNEVWFDGFSGCVETYALVLTPLVALAVVAATTLSHRSEIESTILSRGFPAAFLQLARSTFPTALGASILGILLLVSDGGAGRLMGVHTIAGELLIEFSANYDLAMTTLKATALVVLVAPLAIPGGLLMAKSFSYRSSSRSPGFSSLDAKSLSLAQRLSALGSIAFFLIAPPLLVLLGITAPWTRGTSFFGWNAAFEIFQESLGISFFYSIASGVVSCSLGLLVVTTMPWKSTDRVGHFFLAVCLVLFAVPPMINALGTQLIASHLPASFDSLTRGPLLVAFGCGFRNTPLAILFLLPAWHRIPQGRLESLKLSRVSYFESLVCYLVPALRIPLISAFSLIALLSIADATSLAFLQPPGRASFSSHLFAMMDNTPKQVIAAMCLLYFLFPVMILGLTGYIAHRWNRSDQVEQMETQ